MQYQADFLVIGSGIAGLSFALKAAKHGHVLLISKNALEEGATRYAQGGIAAVFSEDDSFESHIQDTLEAGAGLCHRDTVECTVQEGPERVRELIELGVPFSKKTPDAFDLTKEGGHRARRILHVNDLTGLAIEKTLLEKIRAEKNIQILENHIAIDLITDKNTSKRRTERPTRCLGAYVLHTSNNQIHTASSRFVVLASGGAGKVYLYTTNPDTATGDGIAMAYRAGARIANMEFMQFHPTCLYHPRAKSFLISEALRGEGGELLNSKGEAFMPKYHAMGSLAPRDIVARAIDAEMKRLGSDYVHLDMTKHPEGADYLRKRFPNIYERCLQFGVDMTKEPIPVVPAAHYTCGGVLTNTDAETSLENLFAIGETACTGLHGANRLASNSLLEGAVFAERALRKIESRLKERNIKGIIPEPLPEWDSGQAVPMEERINIQHTWREIRMLMWNYAGIVRTTRRLEKARSRLDLIRHEVREYYWNYLLNSELIELRNIVCIAELIVQSALQRKESRGLHYNLDHPTTDDVFFLRDTIL